ncbi:MAG: helicase C-terminal domain-containing protein [Candidatus Latescibacterota bacterium]
MSLLESFVAFDVETTGLDPKSAELLEIGAVRVVSGKITDRFDQWVKPTRGIPLAIRRLTGITDAVVRDAPEASEAVTRFLAFAQDTPLVAHNAFFDVSFLNAATDEPIRETVYDSLELSRILLPRLVNHKLPTLLGYFECDTGVAHRAGGDAEGAALVFLRLMALLSGKELKLLRRLMAVSAGTGSSIEDLFGEAVRQGTLGILSKKIAHRPVSPDMLKAFFNVEGDREGDEFSPTPERSEKALDVEEIAALFSEQADFHQQLPGYEVRTQQIRMASEVCQAYNRSELLVAEAGTGTGKSIAYLVPALYWGVRNGDRTIVSTNTKNLQEQLFFKDLPQLRETLDLPFRAALLKGRGNYLCLNKWTRFLESDVRLTREECQMLLMLIVWAEETETGDIEENSGFSMRGGGHMLWSKICSESSSCLGQKCRYYNACFLMRIRRAALKAHIVVVNHSLLFSDLSSENAVLGNYRNVILDEAHNLEKIAAQYLGRELSLWRIRNLVTRLFSKGEVEGGLLPMLRNRIAGVPLKSGIKGAFETEIELLMELCDSVWRMANDFFGDLALKMNQHAPSGPHYTQKIRYKAETALFAPVSKVLIDLIDRLSELSSELTKFGEWLRELATDAFQLQEELTADLDGRRQEAQEITGDLLFVTAAEDKDTVYWVEMPLREDSNDLRFFAAPSDVSTYLSEQLYSEMRTIVFTSATLAIRGNFKYFSVRLGLDGSQAHRVRTLGVGAPFDYGHQVLVCVPSFLPSPKAPTFQQCVSDLLLSLVTRTHRGALALFTSYGMLNRSYQDIKEALDAEGTLLLGQGLDGSRTHIIGQFKEDRTSVLFGTDSFWEGIDVPGEALELLVITKLPFAVPTEPLVAAQIEKLEEAGKNAFLHYSVPEAVIRFRQGFGRLIRHRNDVGVVIVLDNRVITSRYGNVFLDSLPVGHRIFATQEEMMVGIGEWFESR